jgi:hypothetical protein
MNASDHAVLAGQDHQLHELGHAELAPVVARLSR